MYQGNTQFFRQVFLSTLVLFSFVFSVVAQYGNEWIDFEKTYYKFKTVEDGIYRIPQATLADAGLGAIPGVQFRLYRLGSEVPIYTSAEGVFSDVDFIEFYGVRNRGELDRALFQEPDVEQLNPEYSMFSDSSSYFLTWEDSGQGLRITQIVNDLSSPPPAESYYMHQDEWLYSEHSVDPRNASEVVSYSRYQEGEGFASPDQASFTLDISSSMMAASGPDALLSVRFTASTYTNHDIVAVFAGDTIGVENNGPFSVYQMDKAVAAGAINSSALLHIENHVTNAKCAVAFVQWTYPRFYDFSGQNTCHFNHSASGSEQYFELNNFVHGGMDPVIIDRNSGVRLIGSRDGNTVQFLLPVFTGERDIIVTSQADGIHQIDKLTDRTFTDYSGDNSEYIIITHPALRTGSDVVAEYAQYRNSTAGGGYHVNIYGILDLYDQFGYGIAKHPQAIRNFAKMIRDQWTDIKMALIIGKGITYSYSRTHGSDAEQHLLVPTFGNPGADNLLFTENGISLPPFPIGRLPVSDPAQLQSYLSKVVEYEQVYTLPQTIADKGWTKHILHMGGGADADQQNQILNLLNQMADIAITTEFGAYVSTFTKNSTNSTGQSNSDRILDILHDGTSVVKFFGHSSASNLDFQINNPRDWQNKGKYPIFSAMGCRAGDIHQDFLSLSENFVFEPDAGTIAFVAGSGSQYLNVLGDWGSEWYLSFGTGVNTMTLGETLLESLGTLNQFGGLSSVLLIEQQTLNGDPAIRFYSSPGPDYVWDYKSVKHAPDLLTVSDPSFTLTVDVVNLGANHPDTTLARVEQKFPDGTIKEILFDTVYLNGFRTTLDFVIPIERISSGLNTLFLTIDALNETVELPDPAAEENNELADAAGKKGVDIFILDNRARATYPTEFSIVTDPNPELIASSTNAFIKGARFVMEIDTTAEFDSPVKLREYFEQFGGTLKWQPIMQFTPGTVYYWRVSIDSISNVLGYNWDVSSFLYEPDGVRGWNQSHYYQFLRDDFDGLEVSENRRFSYARGVKNVWVQNAVNTGPFETFNYFVDNTNNPIFYRDWNDTDASVFVSVYDTTTGKTLKNPSGGAYGAINPFTTQKPVFPFRTDSPESREALMTFIADIIPSGYYVVLHTYQRTGHLDYYPEQWEADSILYGRNIFSVIEHIYPESEIRKLKNGAVPYTFLFRKDHGVILEQVALNYDATINADFNIPVLKTSGNMMSRTVGPAFKWQSMNWESTEIEIPEQDKITVAVFGVTPNNADTILLIDATTEPDIDLSFIDAKAYPYLLLQLHTEDPSDLRTSPQLTYWRVLYIGKPEFLYVPASTFMFHSDSLNFGDSLHFMTSIQNISPYASEAMEVSYTLTNRFNENKEIRNTIPPLAAGGMTTLELQEQIIDTDGDHTFLAELNPGQVQGEVYHFNNFGLRNFYVLADRIDPILDVTFDGRHLENGDVVSSSPEIILKLSDENRFLPIMSPDNFELYILAPNAFTYEKVDLTTDDISFTPSDPGSSLTAASITWHPTFLLDGYYSFRAIATDMSGNLSPIAYEITFEIADGAYLLDVAVSPNPFRDQTRFTFVLTGHEPPSRFTIRITDVTGKPIRTLDLLELGKIYVGSHYSDVIWDGTSDSGALVSSGLYFYTIDTVGPDGREYNYQKFRGNIGKILFLR